MAQPLSPRKAAERPRGGRRALAECVVECAIPGVKPAAVESPRRRRQLLAVEPRVQETGSRSAIGSDARRVSRYENGRITPSLDALTTRQQLRTITN